MTILRDGNVQFTNYFPNSVQVNAYWNSLEKKSAHNMVRIPQCELFGGSFSALVTPKSKMKFGRGQLQFCVVCVIVAPIFATVPNA